MKRILKLTVWFLAAALLLSGCALRTVEDMYRVPRRSESYNNLQAAMDLAMDGLEYAAPLTGENQQTVQTADLDGDGTDEYLLFARGNVEDPLKIFVFRREGNSFDLFAGIDTQGSAFAQVEYADMDGKPGVELVVGRQVSDSVMRTVDVYTFADGEAIPLMAAGYSRLLTCDLNMDGIHELMLISPGELEDDNAVAVLYSVKGGRMDRSREVELSGTAESVKRVSLCRLRGDVPAVYVAGTLNSNVLVTDLLVLRDGLLMGVPDTDRWQGGIQTLRNYYVYAEDIDGDGILEMPRLISMRTGPNPGDEQQYLIQWFSVNADGVEEDELYTFHNYAMGWYLELSGEWAQQVRVEEDGDSCIFRIWDEEYSSVETAFSIHTLVSADREVRALENNRFVLYRGEGVVYAARLETSAVSFGIDQEYLINHFHMILRDWHVGET